MSFDVCYSFANLYNVLMRNLKVKLRTIKSKIWDEKKKTAKIKKDEFLEILI